MQRKALQYLPDPSWQRQTLLSPWVGKVVHVFLNLGAQVFLHCTDCNVSEDAEGTCCMTCWLHEPHRAKQPSPDYSLLLGLVRPGNGSEERERTATKTPWAMWGLTVPSPKNVLLCWLQSYLQDRFAPLPTVNTVVLHLDHSSSPLSQHSQPSSPFAPSSASQMISLGDLPAHVTSVMSPLHWLAVSHHFRFTFQALHRSFTPTTLSWFHLSVALISFSSVLSLCCLFHSFLQEPLHT